MLALILFVLLVDCVKPSIDEDVRWLQFVQRFQSQLNINSSINSLPMCTTWLSNNYQSTTALDLTLNNMEKWGKHCVSKYDCISGRISFQSHGLTVTEQLNAGVRRLVLELHYVPGLKKNLRLCASLQVECTAMKKSLKIKSSAAKRRGQYNWCKSFMMMNRGVHTGCHSGSPQFKDIMREIIKWLNKNQDQFVVIDIVDFVSMETGCGELSEIDSSLKLFGSRLLKPAQLFAMKGDTVSMPSLSQLTETRKNIMFRSTCTFGGSLIFPANKTDYVSLDNLGGESCSSPQVPPSPFTLFYHDKIHVDVILSQRQRLRQYRTVSFPDRSAVQSAARCNAPVALQTTNYSDLFACSWTWYPHHTNLDCAACTAFSADMRTQSWGWLNTNCSLRLHLPCRSGNGTYTLTESFHHLPNALPTTREDVGVCGVGKTFSLPLNPREAFDLATAMWRHGISHVWLPRIPLYTCAETIQYIKCGRPASPLYGTVTGDDFGFDGVVKFECDVGYNLTGPSVSVCQSNGTWSGELPTCTRVDCGEPRQPQNGRSYGVSTDFGSMVGYTCNWGYVFEGQVNTGTIVTTCRENGKWDVVVPDCIQRQCEVSEWSDWGECSHSCASGTQTRTREVVRFQGNEINGNCPPLEETQVCNARPCDTCTTTEYSTNIEADQCRSAESVINRYCSGACREKGMCCRPVLRSTQTIILFCDDSRPRNFQLPVIEKCGCIPCG